MMVPHHFKGETMIALFAFMSIGFANPLDEHLDKISDKYKGVTGIRASFIQETSNPFLPKPVVQEGFVHISKPSLLHWEFQKPMEQHFYADAEKITIWSPVQNQVIISSNQQNDDISALLTDLPSLQEKYVIQLVETEETPNLVQFSLQSKEENPLAQGDFSLWFDKTNYILQRVVVKTENALTTVKFANMSLNPKFEDSEFVFTPPKGADVQDSRQ
jgi:outer membrane lipoprotein-sorting protein